MATSAQGRKRRKGKRQRRRGRTAGTEFNQSESAVFDSLEYCKVNAYTPHTHRFSVRQQRVGWDGAMLNSSAVESAKKKTETGMSQGEGRDE